MKSICLAVPALCLIFMGLSPVASGQNISDVESKVNQLLVNRYKKFPQEKLFIHTDQNLYVNGQWIWYKVYASAYGKPSDLSKIVYVQLTDSAGNVLMKNKLLLTNGHANGDIEIPRNLHSGWYQLTAFTAWMMNFGKEGFHRKNIYVQNFNEVVRAPVQHTEKYHITFFPEGGDPIEGHVCNVAFRACDQGGIPVNVEGEVVNSDKQAIAKIITVHDGMGLFSIEGYSGKKNTAIIRFPDGSVQSADLPRFKKTGLIMQVDNSAPDAVELKIGYSGDPQQYKNVLLAAYQDNGMVQTYPLQLSNGINVFDIKKSDFPTGILRLTLFDQQSVPQAERIVFIDKNDQLKLSLTTDSISFKPKAPSAFKLDVTANGKPAAANLSVSVTDADAVEQADGDNIYTSLLLSSELKGKVYHPAYYFTNNTDSLKQQLDLVMMTTGWRHFKWEKDTLSLRYPIERTQFIAGRIVGYRQLVGDKNKLKVKIIVTSEVDSSKYVGYGTPDSTGSFILKDYNHKGPATVYFEVADEKNHKQKIQVQFLRSIADTIKLKGDTLAGFSIPGVKSEWLGEEKMLASGNVILLSTVEIKTKKLTPTEQVIKKHVMRLETDQVYSFDLVNDDSGYGFTDIISLMQGRFPGLQIYGDKNNASFLYHGGNSLGYGKTDHLPGQPNTAPTNGAFLPYFYLNEQLVKFGDITDIPLPDIALIQFAPAPVWFAPYNGGNVGAIMIYTRKQGDDVVTFRKEAFDRYIFNGYSIPREFASPDYGGGTSKSISDTRTTLYWNHDLNTGSFGEVRFRFYNSDKAKRYRVVIQGMDAQGRIGYLNQVF